jgi:uncharacterized protein YecE (DUF72 family)
MGLFGRENKQLGLFDSEDEAEAPDTTGRLLELRERLPERLRLGTSSWTFPGWAGLVYQARYPNQRSFVRESLAEYAQHPLMRTVGIDRGYYTPVPSADLAGYAEQLPADFRAAIKVWQQVSMPVYPRHASYGARAGRRNSAFLDAGLFEKELFKPVHSKFAAHMGPWILEIAPSPVPIEPDWFCEKLAAFLSKVPRDFPFAVELRDPRLLTPGYVATLREHEASHVFNYWSKMPSLQEQLAVPGLLSGPVNVVRLLLPPGGRYDELKKAYAPFDRLVAPQPQMRSDVVALVRKALERGMESYVIVNNKAEGCSPLTVAALAERLAE